MANTKKMNIYDILDVLRTGNGKHSRFTGIEKRFRKCNAYTVTFANRYVAFWSYSTLICVWDKEAKILYICNDAGYSPTTYMHMRKFGDDFIGQAIYKDTWHNIGRGKMRSWYGAHEVLAYVINVDNADVTPEEFRF